MGKGIAVIFKKKFGGVDDIKSQGQKPGGVAVLKRGERYVYYLVTKEKYFHKPTYKTLESSLVAMKEHCVSHGIISLSMPRIGCGLDGLQWPRVQNIIEEVFQDTDIKVTVYTFCHSLQFYRYFFLGQKPGGVAVLKRGERYVYYLVTKEKYFHKPTYKTLESSLVAMKGHCVSHGIISLSMPRIGCGLDGLQWPRVQNIIEEVFQDTDIRVTVYTL
ncbi:PREDICTED: O-acetyl-ADP-ribose deacetylase 1-like [Acropora digitifera]|uniref:O-acetyl-ADP-ribose deacetylase 1-like n=1 Tax=Acropora digitifera TaxID=70779 RepID=UPI00077A351F|nr:PREDICTED: O-acetyl-ADP-ribose deacetylase 1-like [Acropora digitifera]